ncbi:MAG: ATP-binding protein [bacterium]
MRLADFILRDMEPILAAWEAFAVSLFPASAGMTSETLRDHAQQILEAVAKDLVTLQTQEAQAAKSKGQAPVLAGATETAAQTHATLRARGGLNINQLVSEYRALRASVLRLWTDVCQPEDPSLEDIIRFNEAIDQAVAESVRFYSAQVDRSRNLFLGMLGHDMRSPLQSIQMTASYLASLNAGAAVSEAASRLIGSGAHMQSLLNDLVDFNRIRLGLGINIVPTQIDLATLVASELKQLRAAHPDRRLELQVAGDTAGCWDGLRLRQLLDNLISNAIQHGAPDAPVIVVVSGEAAQVRFEVRNAGTGIEGPTSEQIFDPLQRGIEPRNRSADGGLGLGLYIAREIATAHGGEIEARFEKTESVFCVRLPRRRE